MPLIRASVGFKNDDESPRFVGLRRPDRFSVLLVLLAPPESVVDWIDSTIGDDWAKRGTCGKSNFGGIW